MDNYIGELSEPMYAVYKLLGSTGMRISDVIQLEAGSIKYNAEYSVWTILFVPHKVLKHRRKHNLPDEHLLVIPESVARIGLKIEMNSLDYRTKHNSKYIFLSTFERYGTTRLMQSQSITNALNKIAERHSVVDENGNLWHFTSRQYRKTLAVNMIDNGASLQEVSTQLAHIGDSNTLVYYAEVNHNFFEKKFKVIMTEEKLSGFTEEQRKKLYIDFCLSQREVEFGVCIKPFSNDTCEKIVCQSNCATCTNLCTGAKYLNKWQLLLSSQTMIVKQLLQSYEENNITDYCNFREYQRENYLLSIYQDTVKNIIEKSDMKIYD